MDRSGQKDEPGSGQIRGSVSTCELAKAALTLLAGGLHQPVLSPPQNRLSYASSEGSARSSEAAAVGEDCDLPEESVGGRGLGLDAAEVNRACYSQV